MHGISHIIFTYYIEKQSNSLNWWLKLYIFITNSYSSPQISWIVNRFKRTEPAVGKEKKEVTHTEGEEQKKHGLVRRVSTKDKHWLYGFQVLHTMSDPSHVPKLPVSCAAHVHTWSTKHSALSAKRGV